MKPWVPLAAAGGALVTSAVFVVAPVTAQTSGTISACINSSHQLTHVTTGAPLACPGQSPVSWPGNVGPSPSPSPSPTGVSPSPSPTTASPSPTSASPSPSPTSAQGGTGQVVLTGPSGLALDNTGAVLHDGNPVAAQAPDPAARSQQWQVESKGSYVLIHPDSDPAMCLDEVMSTGQVDIWGCGGGPNQQWVPQAGGSLRAAGDSPKVLTAGAAGAQVTVAAPGQAGQAWQLPTAPAPSPSPSPTSGFAWCSNDPNAFQSFPSGLDLYNNSWNAGEAGPQSMCANSASDWQVISTQPDLASDPGSVKTYPEVQANYPDTPLSQFAGLTSSYSESMPLSLPRLDAEAAYDVWLGNTSVATTEIMFWVEDAGQSPGGDLLAQGVSFGGAKWDLWGGGGTYFAFVPAGMAPGSYGGSQSGSVDILAGINWLVANGYFAADAQHLMRQVNFGWEICSTGNQPGTFTVSSYSVTAS